MSVVADLRHLLRGAGFRKLAVTRLLSQFGDGVFQAGLASLLFFDPTHQSGAAQIALGFFLLLAPFTLVGPLVGPLVDRWQRQRIVLVGNLIRVGLTLIVGATMAVGGWDGLVYAGALGVLSLNRFLLAALAAAIPRVVVDDDLLAANSILPTLGTLAALLGGGVGVALARIGGTEDSVAVVALAAAAATFASSSWAATRIGRTELGPAHPLDPGQLRERFSDLMRGLREGTRYLVRRVTPAHALLVMAVQRFLYGLVFVAAIVIARNVLANPADTDAGLAAFAAVLVFAGVGFGLAAILTPTLGPWVSRHTWVVWCCVVGATGQVVLAMSASALALYVGAAVVSFAVQGGKIAVDTIVQRDTEDDVRGRAFILYDMAYNVAFVSSAGVAALVLPDSGYSRGVMLSLAAAYLVVAALYAAAPRTPRPLPAQHAPRPLVA
jgi:hypothetical protein